MNILMTNHSLEHVGGTEKWTYTMAKELASRGHEIDVCTLMQGETSGHMEEFARIAKEPLREEYDFILANHPSTSFYLYQERVGGQKIYTAHGPSHRLETPIPGGDRYVAVSDEVRAVRLAEGYRFPWEVITNGVDLDDFTPGNKKPKHVLVACKNADAGNMAIEAAIRNGCTWDAVHYTAKPTWDMASLMRDADVVIGCGRTAIEGMASGANVLVFDFRSKKHGPRTDGWVTQDNVDHLRQFNFSCRGYGAECSLDTLTSLLGMIPDAGWQRGWSEKNSDIRTKADEYLNHKES
jgi:hypothetical protein